MYIPPTTAPATPATTTLTTTTANPTTQSLPGVTAASDNPLSSVTSDPTTRVYGLPGQQAWEEQLALIPGMDEIQCFGIQARLLEILQMTGQHAELRPVGGLQRGLLDWQGGGGRRPSPCECLSGLDECFNSRGTRFDRGLLVNALRAGFLAGYPVAPTASPPLASAPAGTGAPPRLDLPALQAQSSEALMRDIRGFLKSKSDAVSATCHANQILALERLDTYDGPRLFFKDDNYYYQSSGDFSRHMRSGVMVPLNPSQPIRCLPPGQQHQHLVALAAELQFNTIPVLPKHAMDMLAFLLEMHDKPVTPERYAHCIARVAGRLGIKELDLAEKAQRELHALVSQTCGYSTEQAQQLHKVAYTHFRRLEGSQDIGFASLGQFRKARDEDLVD